MLIFEVMSYKFILINVRTSVKSSPPPQKKNSGRVMTQMSCHRPFTVKDRVQSQGIYDGENGTRTGWLRMLPYSPSSIIAAMFRTH
jgi:hypothetical protein